MSKGKHRAYRGYQTWRSILSMSIGMHIRVFLTLFIVLMAVLAIYTSTLVDIRDLFGYGYNYISLMASEHITHHLLDGRSFETGSAAWAERQYLENGFLSLWYRIRLFFPYSLMVYLMYPVIIYLFARRSKRESETVHIRGPKLKSPKEVREEVARDGEATDISIGEAKLPIYLECQHAYIVGTTGTGKTAFLRQTLDRFRARNECGIIYDLKGDFVSAFYNPSRDFIFNPTDSRCAGWNVFNDIKNITDINSFTASLIPKGVGENAAHWNTVSRAIFSGIVHYLFAEGKTSNRELWKALTSSPEEIHDFLAATDGGKAGLQHMQDPSSKYASSALSTMMSFVSVFGLMEDIDGDFSFHDWLRNRQGWIFVVNTPKVQEILRPILSLAVDIVAKEILSLPDDRNRRIFMMIDELGTLHQLSSLIDILTLGRSKGASLWLATQDFGRVNEVYGKDIAGTIFNNCSTRICFRVNDPDTAEFLERAFGEREISEVDDTVSMGPDDRKDGLSFGRKKKMEKIVLASEMMELPNLLFYLKMGHYSAMKTSIMFTAYHPGHKDIIMRDDLDLSEIKKIKKERPDNPWEKPFLR